MSTNLLKSLEYIAEHYKERFINPTDITQRNVLPNTKSNIVPIDDLEKYNIGAIFNTEILIKSMNNPKIKIDVGYDRYGDSYMHFESNKSSIIISFDTNDLNNFNNFFQNKINKLTLIGSYGKKNKLIIENTKKGVFRFSSSGTKPLFMNSRDMATLSIFFENCLIDKLLDI